MSKGPHWLTRIHMHSLPYTFIYSGSELCVAWALLIQLVTISGAARHSGPASSVSLGICLVGPLGLVASRLKCSMCPLNSGSSAGDCCYSTSKPGISWTSAWFMIKHSFGETISAAALHVLCSVLWMSLMCWREIFAELTLGFYFLPVAGMCFCLKSGCWHTTAR